MSNSVVLSTAEAGSRSRCSLVMTRSPLGAGERGVSRGRGAESMRACGGGGGWDTTGGGAGGLREGNCDSCPDLVGGAPGANVSNRLACEDNTATCEV
jgi:hypothetical protein